MDEVRQIVESYKAIREKTQYLKNYFEHIDACYKKCSDLLFRAAQIPRNTSWNDLNVINILEMGERQRTVFDEMSSLHNLTISKDVEELLNHVSEEITQIESDLGDIIKVNNTKMKEIERIKNLHKASWIEETDPWITDVKLKSVISKMYQTKEQNDCKVRSKLNMYTDKLKYTQDLFTGLINNFKKIQKSLFNNLLDSLNFKVNVNEDFERFFDAVNEEKKDNLSSKYVDAYNGIIETISKDLSSKNITVYKHLEPVKYGLVKARKGITGDWFLCFIVVTERKFLHLFDISPLYPSLSKYTQLLSKLKSNLNRGIVSIFDFKKNAISFVDERNLTCLSDEIKENIDKIIDSIYLTLSLSNKNIKIEKDKLIINIDDKNQSGFSSLFGMNIIRIKTFTLTHCYELFFGMTNKNESQIKETNEKIIEEVQMPSLVMNLNNDKIIKIDEENPWVE